MLYSMTKNFIGCVALPLKIPEEAENFTVTLLNVTGGARLGNALNASMWINRNDDPLCSSGRARPLLRHDSAPCGGGADGLAPAASRQGTPYLSLQVPSSSG